MDKLKVARVSGAAVVLIPATAHAYIDPGTGSILLQGLLATIAAGLVVGRLYWSKLKRLFKGGDADNSSEASADDATPR